MPLPRGQAAAAVQEEERVIVFRGIAGCRLHGLHKLRNVPGPCRGADGRKKYHCWGCGSALIFTEGRD